MAYNSGKGTVYYIEEKNFCLIPISKNGSTSFRETCDVSGLKYEVRNFLEESDFLNDKIVAVILREPIDRFVSGYFEINVRAHDSPKTLEKEFWYIEKEPDRFNKFINEVGEDFFDTHIEPQMYYITDNDNNIIKIDKWILLNDMSSELQKILNVNFKKRNDSNVVTKQIIMPVEKSWYHTHLNYNTQYKSYLEFLYKDDILLYNKILKEKDTQDED